MDVNGTRFHLVLGEADWQQFLGGATGLTYDPIRGGVALESRRFQARSASGPSPDPDARRGAAVDRFGHWYWLDLDDEGRWTIWFAPQATGPVQPFWPRPDRAASCDLEQRDFVKARLAAPPPVRRLRGLTVTEDHHLVVGLLDPGGLWIFDLFDSGPPFEVLWPVPFHPFDMAARSCGGLVILELPPSEPARFWTLDRRFRVVPPSGPSAVVVPARTDDFRPLNGPARTHPARRFPSGIDLSMATALPGARAMAIETLPDDSVLVLFTDGTSEVHRFVEGAHAGLQRLDGLRAHDLAFAGDPDRVLVAVPESSEAVSHRYVSNGPGVWSLTPETTYLPLNKFGMRAIVGCGQHAYFDRTDRIWARITGLPRPRYAASGEMAGPIIGGELGFDGRTPACVWHRLFLDACIPSGTRVIVESRAADDRAQLAATPWSEEPTPYARPGGSELPYLEPVGSRGAPRDGTWELLFQRASGRYLQLRIRVEGSGRETPVIRALRVYYPRFSYLERYLPAVYREDESSASFMDRFLANAEGILTELEGRIAEAQVLFDPSTVPPELLEWLGGWLGLMLDRGWDEARRRLFVRNAIRLYRLRGTPRGIELMAELATTDCPDARIFDRAARERRPRGRPRVVERFATRTPYELLQLDPSDSQMRPRIPVEAGWLPVQGGAALHQRFRSFLEARYATKDTLSEAWQQRIEAFEQVRFSAIRPLVEQKAADWRTFLREHVAFTYADVQAADLEAYRTFLARRGVPGAETAELPEEDSLPADGRPLDDWIHFVSVELPVMQAAHRFTLLVPAAQGEKVEVIKRRIDRARAVVEREKPAHTEFEVRVFWDLFRVGFVRLGIDTELGDASRFFELVLDESQLAETFVPEASPSSEKDRFTVGRDATRDLAPLT